MEPHEIEQQLIDAEQALLKAAADFSRLALDAATKRATYDVSYAQSLLQIKDSQKDTKVTVVELESMTVLAVQESLRSARIAEAMADAAKRHLSAVESVLSSIQTRARLMQSQMNLR